MTSKSTHINKLKSDLEELDSYIQDLHNAEDVHEGVKSGEIIKLKKQKTIIQDALDKLV